MKITVIRKLLSLVDQLVKFISLGKLEMNLEHKYLVSSFDEMIARELDAANKVIDENRKNN